MNRLLDVILRRTTFDPKIPTCNQHGTEKRLRGKQGRPTRFSEQTEEEYTLLYYCPADGCNHTSAVSPVKTQIPVPGEAPERPAFARADDV